MLSAPRNRTVRAIPCDLVEERTRDEGVDALDTVAVRKDDKTVGSLE